jgi:hypothetical protein
LKDNYILYTSDADFVKDETFQQLDRFKQQIALIARNIFGNFIPVVDEETPDYFSSLTMSVTGRIIEDKSLKDRYIQIRDNITFKKDFVNYYDSLSHANSVAPPEQQKVLKRTLK